MNLLSYYKLHKLMLLMLEMLQMLLYCLTQGLTVPTLVRKVGPKWVSSQQISYAAFGNKNENEPFPICVTEVPCTFSLFIVQKFPQKTLKSLGPLHFSNKYEDKKICIDILIGLDNYWKFFRSGVVVLLGGLIAQGIV